MSTRGMVEAKARHDELIGDLEEKIAALAVCLSQQKALAAPHWGDVGDLAEACGRLKGALHYLGDAKYTDD